MFPDTTPEPLAKKKHLDQSAGSLFLHSFELLIIMAIPAMQQMMTRKSEVLILSFAITNERTIAKILRTAPRVAIALPGGIKLK